MGGRQLADGVAEQVVGCESPGLQEPEQRHLDGEQPGLGVLGAVDQLPTAEHDVADRVAGVPFQFGAHLVEGEREGRVLGVQFLAHAWSLGALPGEQERGLPPCRRSPHGGPEIVEARGVEHDGTLAQRGAAGRQGPGDVHVLDRRSLEVGSQRGGLGTQRGVRPGREDPRDDGWGGPLDHGRLVRGMLEDDVGVRTADPEGGHAGPSNPRAG